MPRLQTKSDRHSLLSATTRLERFINSNSRKHGIILRRNAAKRDCLFVRQSFFHNDPKKIADVGGSVLGCRGFNSSFRTTQGGLSLNIDVSTIMIIQPDR